MGNNRSKEYEPYQNMINTTMIKFDQSLVNCDALFYQEYNYKDEYLNAQDKLQVDIVVKQLTSADFLNTLKDPKSTYQDYEKFLKINNVLINDKRLIFVTLSIIHELLSLLILYQTKIEVNLSDKKLASEMTKTEKNFQKEIKKIQTEYEKLKKTVVENNKKELIKQETILKKETKEKNQKGIQQSTTIIQQLNQQLNIDMQKIKPPNSTEPIVQAYEFIKNQMINKFLPIFSKYNFNVMNKLEYQTRYQDYLESQYRLVAISIAKIFNSISLYKVQGVLSEQEKFWENYQIIQPNKTIDLQYIVNNVQLIENKYQKCVQNILDLLVSDLILQGNIMKMTVRYKIKAFQQEDLDTSIEVGVDSVQVLPTREIQYTILPYHKQQQQQLTATPFLINNHQTAYKVSDLSDKLIDNSQLQYKEVNLSIHQQNPTFSDLKPPKS